MKKSVLSFLAVATIAGGAAASVQAEEVTVKKGDTIWSISQKYNTTVEQVKEWNNLSSNTIYIEDVLNVYEEEKYKVNKGDTLWGIAKELDVKVDSLKNWNNLSSEVIHPDQELVVYPGAPSSIVKESTVHTPVENTESTPTKEEKPAVNEDTNKEQAKEEPAETVDAPKEEKNTNNTPSEEGAKEITMEATAYTASCEGCSGVTATGINLKENPDAKVISVDPNVIPLGTKVYVEGYGEAIAGDTGGAIKGNKIDIFIPNKEDAINYGRQSVKVTILD
ncbi:LysM peptidoglycan-binding domain-containing protein [Cytobacillus sp. FSL K6-0129]|uniref:LysM peptidoglycan-binding and 3D domain-containing protein n=1 Tax=Cytobacillus sp. FSL K6-0129 TaxID=2921421 RepID=UPI0030FB95DC